MVVLIGKMMIFTDSTPGFTWISTLIHIDSFLQYVGYVAWSFLSGIYPGPLGPFFGFPMMGWPAIPRRMCVITEAKKLGVFADIMDKVQNPALRAIFWYIYILYIYIYNILSNTWYLVVKQPLPDVSWLVGLQKTGSSIRNLNLLLP